MALTILTIIFFLGGFIAILYSIVALLSMLKFSRAQKALPEKHEPESGKPGTSGPPVADAFCRRARILLKNERFDAALADCKRAIDINANHAEAHSLWEHALEKEIPPDLAPAPLPETAEIAEEPEPIKKRVKKVLKKVKRKKKVKPKPAPEIRPEEEAAAPAAAEPETEVVAPEEEKPAEIAPEPAVETEVAAAEETAETAAPEPPPETMPSEEDEEEADFDFTPESEAEPAMEPTIQVEAEAEVEPAAEIPEPEKVEEEKTAPPEPGIEPEPEAEPAIQVEAEAEVEPAPEAERAEVEFEVPPEAEPGIQLEAEAEAETAEPGLPEEIKKDRIVDRGVPEPPAGEEQGPLIPEEQLVKPGEPSDGEPLLEELSREQLKEFEEGEAGAGDAEWTRYADKKTGPELPKSKIDMNELPKDAVGLKETLTDLRQAEAYNIQGEDNVSKNLHNNAIKDFTRALEINPNYVDALINRGSAYSQLGRFNDALIDFNHALKFEKKDSELYNKRGEIYLQNNMFDQAIKDFTAAIVLNPMFSDAYLNRGRAYSEKGMPDEAMNDFNHAIKADSDHAFGFIDRAAPGLSIGEDQPDSKIEADDYIKKGLADLENEKYKEAADNFTHAINLFATEPDGYINRGRALIKLNKPDEAMADFNQAVLFDPLNASLYYWRAQAWKEKGDDFNMKEDLKLSCEMGYEPACLEYKKLKPADKG